MTRSEALPARRDAKTRIARPRRSRKHVGVNCPIHETHRMSKWRAEVRAPAGTPRFYSVRNCRGCGEEEAKHPAGHFVADALRRRCVAVEIPR